MISMFGSLSLKIRDIYVFSLCLYFSKLIRLSSEILNELIWISTLRCYLIAGQQTLNSSYISVQTLKDSSCSFFSFVLVDFFN